jgi:hypothetical protein
MLSLCCYLHRWSLLPSINVCLACAQQSNCTLCYCIEVGGCCIALFCFFCVSFLSCLFVHPWIVLCCSQTILREWGWAFFALSLLLRTLSHFCNLYVHSGFLLVLCTLPCFQKHTHTYTHTLPHSIHASQAHHTRPYSPVFHASDQTQPIVNIPSCGFWTMAMICL